jgi:antitoxin component of MazEF toxin-antitoxin module
MRTTIITIGNSRGIRIPKPFLEESGLVQDVEIFVKKGEIRIVPAKPTPSKTNDTALLSESVLAKDWNRPEEDEAWAEL